MLNIEVDSQVPMHWLKRRTLAIVSAVLGLLFLILGAYWVTTTGATTYIAPQSFLLYADLLYIVALIPVILAAVSLIFLFGNARFKGWIILITALALGVIDNWDGFILGGILLVAAAVLSRTRKV